MVIEKVISEHGTYYCYQIIHINKGYIQSPVAEPFQYDWVYWYDGVKFFIGRFKDSPLCMVEVSTGATASNFNEEHSKEQLISEFKRRLRATGLTIHEVIRGYFNKSLNMELWKVAVCLTV